MKTRRIIASLLLGLPLLGLGARADADAGRRGFRTFPYSATATGGVTTEATTICDNAGHCVTLNTETGTTFGGDLIGTGVTGSAVAISESGVLVINNTATVSGGVRQCGSGTFLYSVRGILDLTQSTLLVYTLDIVPGTGTGDLVGITGRAIGRVDLAVPGASPTVTGTVRCRPAA